MGTYRIRIIDKATGHPWGSHYYGDLKAAKKEYADAINRGGQICDFILDECICLRKKMRWRWRRFSYRNTKEKSIKLSL